jgi:DNA-binding NarL/FixJ family response regulator
VTTQEVELTDRKTFAPPWRELTESGWREYGPPSVEAYARHLAAYRNWAWRPVSRDARSDDAIALCVFMRPSAGELRDDIPEREVAVYVQVYEQGHSVRHVARSLQLHRSTVRTYLNRLRARL